MDDIIDKYFGENKNEIIEDIVIGIDFGTSNSCVSVWRNGNAEIIPDEFGNNTMPSIVAFGNRTRYIGQDAKNQQDLNPKNTIYEIKRLIGCRYSDEHVQKDMNLLSYDIISNTDGNILIVTENGKQYSPEEIISMILLKIKSQASQYLGKNITKAVITVPANFNDSQRQATKDAALIAGLECVRIIHEPTAAALAYGLINKKSMNIIVYDFGGGTLDVSLLNISDNVYEVIGSAGNTHLGGSDFDRDIMRYCIYKFKEKHNIPKLSDLSNLSLQKLRKNAENAKKILSTSLKTVIMVKDFYNGLDLYVSLSRDKLMEICADLLMICMNPIDDVLKDSDLTKKDIDEVILVGGMTRMPAIYENIKKYFGKAPNCSVNPDEVIATGAAIQGYIMTHAKDPFSKSITLLDVLPLSLGIETIGGVMNVLIKRNTIIPITKKRFYTTDTDYETSVIIRIFEGERKMTKDNHLVGEFELKGIPPQPRGYPEIEIKFSVDSNGIITVTAEEGDTQKKSGITITGNKNRLKPEQIEKLIEEAKKFELEDKIERMKKQYYYQIDDLCSNIKTNIEINHEESVKLSINLEIEKITQWLKVHKYSDISEEEYTEIISNLKKKYGMLIFKLNANNDKIMKASNYDIHKGTNIYEDDTVPELTTEMEKIEETNINLEEQNEIKQLRIILKELCYELFDMLSSEVLVISNNHKIELREQIDDTLLWMHIHTRPTIIDYKDKIISLNQKCDDIMNSYKNIFSEDKIITKKQELEELCDYVEKIEINLLKEKISELREWLLIGHTNQEYEDKLNEINSSIQLIMSGYTHDMSINIPISSENGMSIEEFKKKLKNN